MAINIEEHKPRPVCYRHPTPDWLIMKGWEVGRGISSSGGRSRRVTQRPALAKLA